MPTNRLPLIRPYRVLKFPQTPQRVCFGVCAGCALHTNTKVWIWRALCVFLPLIGIPFYLLVMVFVPSGNPWLEATRQERTRNHQLARPLGEKVGEQTALKAQNKPHKFSLNYLLTGLLLLGIGLLVGLTGTQDEFSFPPIVFAFFILSGYALAWANRDTLNTRPLIGGAMVTLGLGLVAVNSIFFFSKLLDLSFSFSTFVLVMLVFIPVAFGVVPILTSLLADLSRNRVRQVRESERADMAAHLHDSVLQTLTLIQKQAGSPERVSQLARTEERELRRWLYNRNETKTVNLVAYLHNILSEIEDRTSVPIELVTVGDAPLNENGRNLGAILTEAANNASCHAHPPITAYIEITASQLNASIKDSGPGFELAEIPPDRHGVRDSIIGRALRCGGKAEVKSSSSGTVVEITLPLEKNS